MASPMVDADFNIKQGDATPNEAYKALTRVSSSGNLSHLAPGMCEAVTALSLLEEVAGGGGPAALATLKEVLQSSSGAPEAAAQQVLAALSTSAPVSRQVQGCRMARAVCLAGGLPALEAAGVHQRLLHLLVTPGPDATARLLVPVAEAIVSCAVRGRGVGDALSTAAPEQLKRLLMLMRPPTDHTADPGPLSQALIKLVSSQLTHASSMPALLSAGLMSVVVQAMPKPTLTTLTISPPTPATATSKPQLAPAPPAETAADSNSVVPPTPTTQEAPTPTPTPAPATVATTSTQDNLTATQNATDATPANPNPPNPTPESLAKGQENLRRLTAISTMQASILSLVLGLSQYHQLHPHLAAAGIIEHLVPLLHNNQPPIILEPTTAAVANLAHGSTACPQALISAGAVPRLVTLFPARDTRITMHAVDALANLMLHHPAAQRQLAASRCVWAPLLGKAAVTGNTTAPATAANPPSTTLSTAATSDAAPATTTAAGTYADTSAIPAPTAPQRPRASNGITALVRLTLSTDIDLVPKALRALANAVLNCPPNQAALVSSGALPALVRLSTCNVMPVARQAVGVLANLLPNCDAAQAAALTVGLPKVAKFLLSRRTSTAPQPPPTTPPTDTTTTATPTTTPSSTSTAPPPTVTDAPSSPTGAPSGDPSPVSAPSPASPSSSSPTADELMERSCLLVANMAAGGRASKDALLGVGVLTPLMDLLHLGKPIPTPTPTPTPRQPDATMNSAAAPPATAAAEPSQQQQQQQPAAVVPGGANMQPAAVVPGGANMQAMAVSQRRRICSAAAGALSNLMLNANDVTDMVVQLGALPLLLELMTVPGQSPDVLMRAAHAVGSAALQSNAAKQVVLDAGAHTMLLEHAQDLSHSASVRSAFVRALGHLALHSPSAQSTLAQHPVVPALVTALQDPHCPPELISASLGALASLTTGCTAACTQFLSTEGAAEALVHVASSPTAPAPLLCACVHALTCQPTKTGAATQHPDQGVVGPAMQLMPDMQQQAAAATVHRMQEALAQAGIVPVLVHLLRTNRPEVVDSAAMGLAALLAGNPTTQKLTASAGGVGVLAAVIASPLCRPPRLALARHVVDAWLELGGATAAAKLLGTTHPVVTEYVCRRISSGLHMLNGWAPAQGQVVGGGAGDVGALLTKPGFKANAAVGVGKDGKRLDGSSGGESQRANTWMLNGSMAGTTGPGETGPAVARGAVASLVKAGVLAALLQVCQKGSNYYQLLASALVALRVLMEVGGSMVRGALIQSGAERLFQSLQVAATAAAANGGGANMLPPAGKPTASSVAAAMSQSKNSAGGGAGLAAPDSVASKVRKAAAPPRPSGAIGFSKSGAVQAPVAARASRGSLPSISPLEIAKLAEQLCRQLVTSPS